MKGNNISIPGNKIGMSQQEFQQKFEQELKDRMYSTFLPEDIIPTGFQTWVNIAVLHDSPVLIGCTPAVYQNILQQDVTKLPLYEFAWAMGTIQRRTPTEMNMPKAVYADMLEQLILLEDQMEAISGPIRKAAQRKIETEARLTR